MFGAYVQRACRRRRAELAFYQDLASRIARTTLPSVRGYQSQATLMASTRTSPRPLSSVSAGRAARGGLGLALCTWITRCSRSESNTNRTGRWVPATRDAWIALVTSSETRSSAGSVKWARFHSRSTSLACSRAHGLRLAVGPAQGSCVEASGAVRPAQAPLKGILASAAQAGPRSCLLLTGYKRICPGGHGALRGSGSPRQSVADHGHLPHFVSGPVHGCLPSAGGITAASCRGTHGG